jgi:antitoxin VapB
MPLNIRHPRAAELARELADRRGTTMTEAIINALESALRQDRKAGALAERFAAIARELAKTGRPGGRDLSKDEIDAMWGH